MEHACSSLSLYCVVNAVTEVVLHEILHYLHRSLGDGRIRMNVLQHTKHSTKGNSPIQMQAIGECKTE